MMNTGDKETAAKTSASMEIQVPPGAADNKDKDEVTAPVKEKVVLTQRETVSASGEVEATINITGGKQQVLEGAELQRKNSQKRLRKRKLIGYKLFSNNRSSERKQYNSSSMSNNVKKPSCSHARNKPSLINPNKQQQGSCRVP